MKKVYFNFKILLVFIFMCFGLLDKVYACAGDSEVCFDEECCMCGNTADIMFDSKAYCVYCAPKCEVCGRSAINELEGNLYCCECSPRCSGCGAMADKRFDGGFACLDCDENDLKNEEEKQSSDSKKTHCVGNMPKCVRCKKNAHTLFGNLPHCVSCVPRCVSCKTEAQVLFEKLPYCIYCSPKCYICGNKADVLIGNITYCFCCRYKFIAH